MSKFFQNNPNNAKTMKNWKLIVFLFVLAGASCQNEQNAKPEDESDLQVDLQHDQPIEETTWKLTGIVDTKTGDITAINQQDNDESFYLYFLPRENEFFGDPPMSIISNANKMMCDYTIDYTNYHFKIKYDSDSYSFLSFEHSPEWVLLKTALDKVQFFSVQENELRLYFNDKKEYLLFNSCDNDCWGKVCVDRIEISENEYIISSIVPEEYNSNKWVIGNHTNQKVALGGIISLDYFDENKWVMLRKIIFQLQDIDPPDPFGLMLGEFILDESTEIVIDRKGFFDIFLEGRKKGKYRLGRDIFISGLGIYYLCSEIEII